MADIGRADITSPANPRIKALTRLRRRRHREAEGRTLVEGYDELLTAVTAGVAPLTVVHCPELARPGELDALRDHPAVAAAELLVVTVPVFERVAYRESPDGWLAVLPAVRSGLGDVRLGVDPLVLVCDRVEKPGNLGAMLRTADATGASAVLATDPGTDWSNPNVIRASKGAVHTVPVATATTPEALSWLAGHGVAVVAATPRSPTPYTEADLRGPLAVAVGSEDEGLSEAWLDAAHHRVALPMRGLVDSLNVSVTAGVLLFEALRQRGAPEAEPPGHR